ncbi:hypothetical protein F4678DRAFT_475465 [Xylaria arbuscula]|nr:hypothetical protein F4678DRAFT_475465 [Xylaria arbuscula]
MTTHDKQPELCFVVKTSMDEFHPKDRKLIRSHVMKGKNLGRMRALGSRKYLDSARVEEAAALSSPGFDSSNHKGKNESGSFSHNTSRGLIQSEQHCDIQEASAPIPPGIGSGASTMDLADPVKPATIEVILQFSYIAKQLLFPMEKCIFFDRRAENWIAPLATDSAYLHANIFSASYYFDAVLSQRPSCQSQRMIYHYGKTVTLLRKRLLVDGDDMQLSNNTLFVILCLAGHAFSAGDLELAVHHLQGIRRIIDLRGGLSSLRGNQKLANEILRCDLGVAIHSGSNPILFRGAASPHSYRMYPKLHVFLDKGDSNYSSKISLFSTSSTAIPGLEIDQQLSAAWKTMSDFCAVINLASKTDQRIDMETFLHSMASIMYNLLDMSFESSSQNETVRLGLLSFSCGVFLPWSHLGMSYRHLNSLLQTHFEGHAERTMDLPAELAVWLLMACAITIVDECDIDWAYDLLRTAASSYGITCWSQMRDMLMSVMWIGIVHERLGQRVFDRL